jgi:malonyl CoA-acyl carrier protein transacylase
MAADGIDTFVHVGPGDVTAGLARKTLPEAKVVAVSSVADIGNALDAIGTMGEL